MTQNKLAELFRKSETADALHLNLMIGGVDPEDIGRLTAAWMGYRGSGATAQAVLEEMETGPFAAAA